MRTAFRFGLKDTWKRFQDDQSGIALIYVTVALPVLVGFSLLAIDVGRLSSLQSSLQHGADALALAGAGELDRRPDAIVRANRAIDNLITTNKSLFATTVVTINGGDIDRHYLDALPLSDALPIDAAWLTSHETSDPADARFVQVIVDPADFNTIFPVTFLGGASNSAQSSAEAVAGMDQAVCNFTPLFMCNPFEPATGTTDALTDYGLYDSIATVASRRRIIALKSLDPASQWTPGNFGFLQANAGPGAKTLGASIASPNPQACFLIEGLNTETGNITSLRNAFNTRFDIYEGAYGGAQDKVDYPPAANVRKGYIVKKLSGGGTPNACAHNNPITAFFSATPPATYNDAMGFPNDSVIGANRVGNGDWGGDTASTSSTVPDFNQYWLTNFGSTPRPTDSSGTQYSNTNLPTRYDIYRYEIANGLVGSASYGYHTSPTANFQEVGTPACNVGAGMSNPDRRIIYAAVINCRAVGMSGGSGGPYDAVAFAKFFMTAPMGDPPDSILFTELVDVVQPGQADSVARDMVQLYR